MAKRKDLSLQASSPIAGYDGFLSEVVALLEAARRTSARAVNAVMTVTYWELGRRIVEIEQRGKERAAYGAQVIERLSLDLTKRFGRGFSRRSLEQMRLFYLGWPIARRCLRYSRPSHLRRFQRYPLTNPLSAKRRRRQRNRPLKILGRGLETHRRHRQSRRPPA